MSNGKGGHRHTPKPQVDGGVLFKTFQRHISLIQDFGKYEQISKSQACHPKGLVYCLPLLKGLIQLEPTCEIHGSSLRAGLFQLLVAEPSINDSPWNGDIWLGIKVERLTCLLFHMRRLQASRTEVQACAAKLTGGEFLQLQEVLQLISKKNAPGLPLVERGVEITRKLKKEISDVSVDSSGFPLSLKSPAKPLVKGTGNETEAEEGTELQQPSFKRKRKGSFAAEPVGEGGHSTIQEALGIGAPLKKPASKVGGKKAKAMKGNKKKKPLVKGSPLLKGSAAREAVASAPSGRMKWAKVYLVTPNKPPWRAYIQGKRTMDEKKFLVVETTQHRHPKYKEILTQIKKKMEQDHITKQEALDMREDLYENYHC